MRLTACTLECFADGRRGTAHARRQRRGAHTTIAQHLPKAQRAPLEWTRGRFLSWASQVGPRACELVKHLLTTKPHPEMGYRGCLGLLSLAKQYGEARLEAACARAFALGAPTRTSVVSILRHGLEDQPLPKEVEATLAPALRQHENLRGADYYQ